MSTSIKILFGATAIIGLLTATAYQQSSITSYEEQVGFQKIKIADQAEIIDEQALKIDELTVNNNLLTDELNLVRDSINILQNNLFVLQQSIKKSKINLNAIKEELVVRQKELDFVKAELVKKENNVTNQAELQAKVATLENQLEQLGYLQQNESEDYILFETEIDAVEENMAEKELAAEKMARLKAILDNTIIDVRGIVLRSERDGANISKIKNNGKNWKYTFINFDLQTANPQFLVEANFQWRIIDMDTGEPISFIESNNVYPDAIDTKGLNFTYSGYAQETVFINTQPKEGKNYELKLYYIEDGLAYFVNGSSRPIIYDKQCID